MTPNEAVKKIWSEWFQFYKKHFREGAGNPISAADQLAFYEIAQPILNKLSTPPASDSPALTAEERAIVDRYRPKSEYEICACAADRTCIAGSLTKIIDRLSSSSFAGVPEGWRPIETVPPTASDGLRVDIWLEPVSSHGGRPMKPMRVANAWFNGSAGSGWTSFRAYNNRYHGFVATHWRHAPAPPGAAAPSPPVSAQDAGVFDALEKCRSALEAAIDLHGPDPAGAMLSAINAADRALSRHAPAPSKLGGNPIADHYLSVLRDIKTVALRGTPAWQLAHDALSKPWPAAAAWVHLPAGSTVRAGPYSR